MSKESRKFVIDSGRSIAATGVTGAIDVQQDDGYCLQTVFTGIAASASGTCVLQISVDGTNFADYSNGSQNYSDTTKSLLWEVTEKRHTYARIKISATSGGSGTCVTTYCGEVFKD